MNDGHHTHPAAQRFAASAGDPVAADDGGIDFLHHLPLYKKFDDVLFYAFLAVGGIGLLYFSYMLASSIYRIFIPQNAMLIDENGFCDYTVCQRGTGFVPWSNVESIKVFGPEDELLLGVTLKSIDRLEEIPDKRVYKELSDNMKTGVPEIILKQSDVKMPLPPARTRDAARRRTGRPAADAENRRRDEGAAAGGHRPRPENRSRQARERGKSRRF